MLLNTSPNNHHVVLDSNCPGQKQPPITSTTSTTPTTPPSPTQHQLHLFHFQHCHNHVILRPTSLIKIILLDAIKNFLTSNFFGVMANLAPSFLQYPFVIYVPHDQLPNKLSIERNLNASTIFCVTKVCLLSNILN